MNSVISRVVCATSDLKAGSERDLCSRASLFMSQMLLKSSSGSIDAINLLVASMAFSLILGLLSHIK